MPINKKWHEENPMPKNASIEVRYKWHVVHQKNCSCRPMPKKLATDFAEFRRLKTQTNK